MTSPETLGRQFDCNCLSSLHSHLTGVLSSVNSAADDFTKYGFPENSPVKEEVAKHLRAASRAASKATKAHSQKDYATASKHLFSVQDAMNSAQYEVNSQEEPSTLGAALVTHAKSVGNLADKYAGTSSWHESGHGSYGV